MKRWALLGFGAILATVSFLAGVYLSRPAPERPELAQQIPPAAVERLFATPFADPDGRPATLTRWQGKPLIVNFWATWCPPCLREIPTFSRLQERHPEVQFVGIAADKAENVQDFVVKNKLSYPVLLAGGDAAGIMSTLGNPSAGLPFTLTVDAAGRPRHVRLGGLPESEIEAIVAELTGR